MTDELLPPPFDRLGDALAGDPDAGDAVFTDDVVLVDHASGDRVDGLDAVREVFAEYAGRRAEATVDEVLGDDERAAVRFTIRFRADAHVYAQTGTAWVDLDGDRIASWESTWVEVEDEDVDGDGADEGADGD